MSAFNVAKFGGTSVADFEAMSRCAAIVRDNPYTKLVVSSACSGVTNLLVTLANGVVDPKQRMELLSQVRTIHQAILDRLQAPQNVAPHIEELLTTIEVAAQSASLQSNLKLTDHLVACGELMSTLLLTQVFNESGVPAVRFDIRQVLKTNANFGCAEPNIEQTKQLALQKLIPLCQQGVVITQGFIASDEEGATTTLGRGGSDYSAALIAEAIEAAGLEIWTDVPGIYTTDPKIAPKAKPIPEISFSEASEAANFGAKILHPSTLLPALRQHIPVFVGSSKSPTLGGTWIREKVASVPLFRALTLRENQTMVTLKSIHMYHSYGFLAKVFQILAKHKISIDLITTSEVSVSLTLDQPNACGTSPQLPSTARQELEELCSVQVEHDLSLIALIGNNMGSTKGSAKDIFNTLKQHNLRMICYGASDHNMCFLVDKSEAHSAIQQLHQKLFE